jgi:hypothetical protein
VKQEETTRAPTKFSKYSISRLVGVLQLAMPKFFQRSLFKNSKIRGSYYFLELLIFVQFDPVPLRDFNIKYQKE